MSTHAVAHPELLYALAVIFAALIGFMGQVTHSWLQKRKRRGKLRRALYTEISSMDWLKDADLSALEQTLRESDDPAHTHVPTTIYDDNISDIGLLSSTEIDAVISYYQAADIATEQLEMISSPERDADEARNTFVDRTVPKLKDRHTTAKKSIKNRLTPWRRIVTRSRDTLSPSEATEGNGYR